MNSKHFLKNVLTLLSGTVLAQAIPILISPILTRIYTPDQIGVYTIFFTTVNILAIFSTARLEQAVLIPKHKKDSYNVVKLSLTFAVIVSVFVLFLLLVLKNPISSLLGLESLSNWILLIPISSFFLAAFQTYNYWLNRNDNYLSISKGKVYQGVISGFVHVTCSILGSLGLVLGRFLSVLLSSIYLFFASRKKSPKLLPVNKKELKNTLITHKDFPLYTMPNAALNSISNNLPIYLLESFYSAKTTGFYSWAVKIVQGPMGMISSSIQQVFFRKASQLHSENGNLYTLTKTMYKRLFLIGIIPYLFVFIFAQDLFGFVFGEEWRVAGEYTSYLIPWFFIMFLNSPISSLVLILNKQKTYLIFEILLFVFRGLSIFIGYYYYKEAKISIILYGAVGLVFNFVLLFILLKISKDASKR